MGHWRIGSLSFKGFPPLNSFNHARVRSIKSLLDRERVSSTVSCGLYLFAINLIPFDTSVKSWSVMDRVKHLVTPFTNLY